MAQDHRPTPLRCSEIRRRLSCPFPSTTREKVAASCVVDEQVVLLESLLVPALAHFDSRPKVRWMASGFDSKRSAQDGSFDLCLPPPALGFDQRLLRLPISCRNGT
jgi:hypothetical protein